MTTNWENERPTPGAAQSWRVEYPEPIGAFSTERIHDDLMVIVMELAAENWVVKRRLRALEHRLEDAGIINSLDVPEEGDEDRKAANAERDVYINRVFGHLMTDPAGRS